MERIYKKIRMEFPWNTFIVYKIDQFENVYEKKKK